MWRCFPPECCLQVAALWGHGAMGIGTVRGGTAWAAGTRGQRGQGSGGQRGQAPRAGQRGQAPRGRHRMVSRCRNFERGRGAAGSGDRHLTNPSLASLSSLMSLDLTAGTAGTGIRCEAAGTGTGPRGQAPWGDTGVGEATDGADGADYLWRFARGRLIGGTRLSRREPRIGRIQRTG